MTKNNLSLITCVIIFFTVTVFPQNDKKKLSVIIPQSETEVLLLQGFFPYSTIVKVKNQKKPNNTPTVFLLETPNIYQANIESSFHKITQKWLYDHPNSLVVEIHRYPLFPQKDAEYARSSYVWIIEGDKNLNIELVKNGACDARTMLLDEEDEKNILIDKERYKEFKQIIMDAEKIAKDGKLGVWKIKKGNTFPQ